MEIVQNRYGTDRVIEKLGSSKIRIIGESLISRQSEDSNGNLTMFDFEGGPCLNVGGKITYKGTNFKIKSIKSETTREENVYSVTMEISI